MVKSESESEIEINPTQVFFPLYKQYSYTHWGRECYPWLHVERTTEASHLDFFWILLCVLLLLVNFNLYSCHAVFHNCECTVFSEFCEFFWWSTETDSGFGDILNSQLVSEVCKVLCGLHCLNLQLAWTHSILIFGLFLFTVIILTT